ncbi:MAG: hypothetical protein WCQ96_03025 [Patescibacteria group bacterium]
MSKTIDGQTAEESIKAFQVGARDILSKLQSWDIGSDEARKLESQAKELWMEDAEDLDISLKEAEEIWQEKIIDEILSLDPAFDFSNKNF